MTFKKAFNMVMSPFIKKQQEPIDLSKVLPTNGGNSYFVREALINQDALNMQTIPKRINKSNGIREVKDTFYNDFQLLLFMGEYFCNRFQIRSEDKIYQEAIYKAIWSGFLYGKSGIWFLDGKIIPFAVSAVSINSIGDITLLKVIPCNNLFNDNITQYTPLDKVPINNILIVPPSQYQNIALYKWNTFGHSAYYRLLPYINKYSYYLKLLNTHSYLYTSKLVLTLNNPDALKTEMEQFINPEVPFLTQLGNDLDGTATLKNKFSILDFNADSKGLIELIEFWKKEMYELLGREFNPVKKERKVTDEVQAEQGGTASCEYDYFNQIELFKYRLEKLHPEKLELGNFAVDKNYINEEKEIINEEGNNEI